MRQSKALLWLSNWKYRLCNSYRASGGTRHDPRPDRRDLSPGLRHRRHDRVHVCRRCRAASSPPRVLALGCHADSTPLFAPPRKEDHRARDRRPQARQLPVRAGARRNAHQDGRDEQGARGQDDRAGPQDRRRASGSRKPDARFREQGLQQRQKRAGGRRRSSNGARPARRAPISNTLGEPDLLETIRASLEQNRVDLYLQPIVSLPQRKLRFYEALSRLRAEDGTVIMPEQYIKVAAPAGLMSVVDNLLLFRCVQIVRRLTQKQRDIGVFCNISGDTLADAEFFPQFLEFMHHNRDLAGQIMFEFAQDAVLQGRAAGRIQSRLSRQASALRSRWIMSQSLALDFAKLKTIGFRHIKVRAHTLTDGMSTARTRPSPPRISRSCSSVMASTSSPSASRTSARWCSCSTTASTSRRAICSASRAPCATTRSRQWRRNRRQRRSFPFRKTA